MRLEVSLTKAEAKALYWAHPSFAPAPHLNWPDGVMKSQARQSAERKLLAALELQLREAPDA